MTKIKINLFYKIYQVMMNNNYHLINNNNKQKNKIN